MARHMPLYKADITPVCSASHEPAKYIETGDVTGELFEAAFGLTGLTVYLRGDNIMSIGGNHIQK